ASQCRDSSPTRCWINRDCRARHKVTITILALAERQNNRASAGRTFRIIKRRRENLRPSSFLALSIRKIIRAIGSAVDAYLKKAKVRIVKLQRLSFPAKRGICPQEKRNGHVSFPQDAGVPDPGTIDPALPQRRNPGRSGRCHRPGSSEGLAGARHGGGHRAWR